MYGFYKRRQGKLAFGVLAGLADRFGWQVLLVRIVFLIAFLFVKRELSMFLTIAYIAAAYFLPYKEDQDAERYGTGPRKRKDAKEIKKDWF